MLESRVVIAATVQSNLHHDPNMWRLWLAQKIPLDVRGADIRVVGGFQGSCPLLLSMPIPVWSMLPRNNAAYVFIA